MGLFVCLFVSCRTWHDRSSNQKSDLSPPREEEDVRALLSPGVTWPGQFIKISPLPEARLSATIEVKQV